ncbi:MAG: alpha-amylase family glycosyl hydrolase [Myxococcota bacterium]
MSDRLWWKHGVVYQIYPRSFMDSNGDGVGDLAGIRARLDHLAWLGIDALWLSPIFPSPMADFGYDVSDYCDVDPVFGDLAEFDALVADAHARGIRVMLDWVPNHTSDRHAWFRESRASRTSSKRDWYVWRDARPGGGPPNNWAAMFGGPAWELDPETSQYYLRSFLKQQPDLNWRSPEVERAMHAVLRFWLERGVDGFRIDVIHRIAKDPELRDNPPSARPGPGWGGQLHVHDENHPDIHGFLRRIRRVLDSYDERAAVGEIGLPPEQVATYYGRGDELQLAFNFSLLRAGWNARAFGRELALFDEAVPPEGWPDLVLSNHDVPRHASRYDDPALGDARARALALLLLTARGTPFLYYGEEIGMRNGVIPPERRQDPLAWTLHPSVSRDPERTPMHWSAEPGAGFTTGEPWLPLASDWATRNVESQRADRESLLWLYRDLLALRRRTPALERGAWRELPAPEGVLAWERLDGGSRALVALNFASGSQSAGLPAAAVRDGVRTRAGADLPADSGRLELGPCEAAALVVDA